MDREKKADIKRKAEQALGVLVTQANASQATSMNVGGSVAVATKVAAAIGVCLFYSLSDLADAVRGEPEAWSQIG